MPRYLTVDDETAGRLILQSLVGVYKSASRGIQ